MGKFPLSIQKKKVVNFCKKHHIVSLGLFGSVLTPHFRNTRDVDVLVQFNKKYIPDLFAMVDMESELSLIMGRQVDLKTPGDLSPYFRKEVVSQAKMIYG